MTTYTHQGCSASMLGLLLLTKMADDIDDLLDEVESKFCDSRQNRPRQNKPTTQNRPKRNSKSASSSSFSLDNDLSDAMHDILDEDGLDLELNKVNKKQVSLTKSTGAKCYPIFLAGTSRSASKKATRICDRLHCTTCDNKVVTFENFDWNSSCDYLFFRNNYPDFSKLKQNLVPCSGSRAYCCQCCWIAAKTMKKLEDCSSFKWICKRH